VLLLLVLVSCRGPKNERPSAEHRAFKPMWWGFGAFVPAAFAATLAAGFSGGFAGSGVPRTVAAIARRAAQPPRRRGCCWQARSAPWSRGTPPGPRAIGEIVNGWRLARTKYRYHWALCTISTLGGLLVIAAGADAWARVFGAESDTGLFDDMVGLGGWVLSGLATGLIVVVKKNEGNIVVLSGHSQGSVVCAAAVLLLDRDPEAPNDQLRLITYGSQLQWAFARLFPRYLGFTELECVHNKLSGRWRNMHRWTDPLGGHVVVWADSTETNHPLSAGDWHGFGVIGYEPITRPGRLIESE
jgi:hypothetical protein